MKRSFKQFEIFEEIKQSFKLISTFFYQTFINLGKLAKHVLHFLTNLFNLKYYYLIKYYVYWFIYRSISFKNKFNLQYAKPFYLFLGVFFFWITLIVSLYFLFNFLYSKIKGFLYRHTYLELLFLFITFCSFCVFIFLVILHLFTLYYLNLNHVNQLIEYWNTYEVHQLGMDYALPVERTHLSIGTNTDIVPQANKVIEAINRATIHDYYTEQQLKDLPLLRNKEVNSDFYFQELAKMREEYVSFAADSARCFKNLLESMTGLHSVFESQYFTEAEQGKMNSAQIKVLFDEKFREFAKKHGIITKELKFFAGTK